MKRLTDRSKEIPLPCADNSVFWARVHEKLARYEDSGLEPEQINCVNTNVYVNWRDDVFNDSGTEQLTIDSVGFMTHDGTFYAFDEIGKTVFLTREDAEKALEGMNNDER